VGSKWQIFSYDFATGQQTQLTSDNFDNTFGRFSPDGKWIVFRKQSNSNVAHIFIMNRVGGSVKQLTTGNTWNGSPEFGPDGYIYFSSNAGNSDPLRKFDNYDIWRLKPNLSE
jgi:Tol biopolymer transport system component